MDKRLRQLLRAGMSPAEAAAELITEASRDELEAMLAAWAVSRAKWMSRRMALDTERRVEANGDTVPKAVVSNDPSVRGLMFMVPGEGLVAWDTATADQHEARARMQRELAGICVEDAERHDEAARMIRDAGVTCLADLGTAERAPTPNHAPRSRSSRRKRQAIAA